MIATRKPRRGDYVEAVRRKRPPVVGWLFKIDKTCRFHRLYWIRDLEGVESVIPSDCIARMFLHTKPIKSPTIGAT